jgi:hypothetical protein
MSFYDSADAIYGSGQYGSASYGVVTPVIQITGVGATGTIQPVAINGFEVDISEKLDSVSATGSVNTVTVDIKTTLAGVAGTTALGTIEPKVDEALGSVSATGSVNTVTVNIKEDVTGVVGTFTLNGAGLSIRSINRVPVTSAGLTGTIGTIEPKVDEALGSVSATGAVGTLTVNLSEKLASVSATGNIGSLEFSNTHSLTSTGITGSIGTVSPNVKEELQLNAVSGVSATGSVNTVRQNPSAGLASVESFVLIKEPNVTAVQFDFEAVAHLYSRRRAVKVPRAA